MSGNSVLSSLIQPRAKKWVEIFDERVQYKKHTKTYRISNQKFRSDTARSRLKNNKIMDESSLTNGTEIDRSMNYSYDYNDDNGLSPSRAQSPLNGDSFSRMKPISVEDNLSVLTEPTSYVPGGGGSVKSARSSFIEPSERNQSLSSYLSQSNRSNNSNLINGKEPVFRECKHTANNLLPPPKQLDYSAHWGTTLLCYACSKPAINDCTVCSKCEMVVHNLCLAERELNQQMPNLLISLRTRSRSLNSENFKDFYNQPSLMNNAVETGHKCPNCEETFEADMRYYESIVQRLKEERLHNFYASMIGYRILIFIEKCRLNRKKTKVIKLQATFRGIIARKKFQQMLQSKQQKILLLHLLQLPVILKETDSLIIVTIFDTFKNLQLFRFDKTIDNVFHETMMIPGVSYSHTLLISVAVKDEHNSNYSLIGQAQLSIRDISLRTRKCDITLNFLERITIVPQDVSGIKTPPLSVPVRIVPVFDQMRDFFVKFRYYPQNPIVTICQMISAPPLDVLKRPAENTLKHKRRIVNPGSTGGGGSVSGNSTGTGAVSTATAVTYRNSKYWICLHQLRLWFYQYYGDVTPRFAADVSDACVIIVREKGRLTPLVQLIHDDNRVWLLEFPTKLDAVKFELALNESKKAIGDLKSIYAKREDFLHHPNFGFNLPLY